MDSNQPQQLESTFENSGEIFHHQSELIGRHAVLTQVCGAWDECDLGEVVLITDCTHHPNDSKHGVGCSISTTRPPVKNSYCFLFKLKVLPKDTEITDDLRAWMKKCYGRQD